MKLTVLGKYGPYPKENEATSSYLLESEKSKLLIESGSGCLAKLLQYHKVESLDGIVISHFHYDHISDLGVINYYLQFATQRGDFSGKINVYIPLESLSEFISFQTNCPFLNFVTVESGKIIKIADFEFEFVQMKHPKFTYGFICSNGNKKFGYTADTNICEGFEKICKQSDFILTDGCTLNKNYSENSPHLSVKIIDEKASALKKNFLVTHLLPTVEEDEYQKEIKSTFTALAKTGASYNI